MQHTQMYFKMFKDRWMRRFISIRVGFSSITLPETFSVSEDLKLRIDDGMG